MRSKRKKLKVKNILLLIGVSLVIAIVIFFLTREKKVYMINVTDMNIDSVKEELNKYNLDISLKYEYDDNIKKGNVVSQSIPEETEIKEGDKLSLVVSRGKLDLDELKADGINELGKVPVMMYHGIVDMKSSETSYTGGNVDKDGYTRTAEAFRNDL